MLSAQKTFVQALLENGNMEEALVLAENFQHRAKGAFQDILNQVRQKTAFVSMKNFELDRAKELFIRGKVDPREVTE
jgi:hypothetical protein